MFLKWLGESVESDLFSIQGQHIQAFRNHLAKTISTAWSNKHLKYHRVFFVDAKRDQVIFERPREDATILV